ncbi:hypothetical protein HBI57_068330 [Parastagonospora nodorum]|nr:hypothetical protein HBI57_068330 [Parastagonospora nodorum]
MSYALAASYLFILLITLTLSKALNITVLLTYLKSALSFSSCYAVPLIAYAAYRNCLVNKDLKLLKQEISAGR